VRGSVVVMQQPVLFFFAKVDGKSSHIFTQSP
jgi:hypothetical protein